MLLIVRMQTLSRISALALASLLCFSAACTVTSERDDAPSRTDKTPTNPSDPSDPSDSPNGSSDACGNIAGTWGTSGTCGNDTCVITQSGCNTNFKCADGAASFTGTVSGNDVAYSGVTAGGAPGSCQGILSGSTITGSCQISGVACTFRATKR